MNVPITHGTSGLRTESDPARSVYNADTGGLRDLAACMNVDVSDAGRLSRRKGMTKLVEASTHSLFPVMDQYLLCVQGDALSVIGADLSTVTPIRNVTPGARMSFCLLDDTVYYVNGFEIGKVVDRVSKPWVAPAEVVGHNVTRQFSSPPIGQRVAYFDGRMYIAQGKAIWYSEAYGPDLFSMGDSFLSFESTITMLRPVAGGLYVSDEHDTWFLAGTDPAAFTWRKVDNLPTLPFSDITAIGTMVLTSSGDYTFIPGKVESAFWLTLQGVIFGGPTGEIDKITDSKIDLPNNEYSSGACLINGSTLIGVTTK